MPDEPIRIWHQSITDLSVLPGYRRSLEDIASRVTSSGTRVDVHGVRSGTYPAGMPPIVALRSPWLHQLLAVQVVQAAACAEQAGYDAVAVSCFFDPGLLEARSLVDVPVVSSCETALIVASSTGTRCGLLALDEWQVSYLRRLVDGYGLADRVAAVVGLSPAVDEHELEAGLADDELLARLQGAAEKAVAAGADVVVPAEGVLNTLTARAGVRELAGAPVIDGFASVLAHAEMLVRLQRVAGLRTTRLGEHWRPPAAATAHLQAVTAESLMSTTARGPGEEER